VSIPFPFHAERFYSATNDWNAANRFIYLQILTHQWTHGGLPDSPSQIAKQIGVSKSTFYRAWNSCIATKFRKIAGLLFNLVVEDIREETTGSRLDRTEEMPLFDRTKTVQATTATIAKSVDGSVSEPRESDQRKKNAEVINLGDADPKPRKVSPQSTQADSVGQQQDPQDSYYKSPPKTASGKSCDRLSRVSRTAVVDFLARLKGGIDSQLIDAELSSMDVLSVCRLSRMLELHGAQRELYEAAKYAHEQQMTHKTSGSVFWRQMFAHVRGYFTNKHRWSKERFDSCIRNLCFRSPYLEGILKEAIS
jgi:hypothetical protein